MGKTKKITLADVAVHAGVSAITVSRALRNPHKVSKALRKRIQHSVVALGYVPDQAARALASGRTDVIGVIIPSVTNSVYSDVLRGIYEGIEETPFDIQLGNTRYSPSKEEDLLRVFLNQKPAGLIVTGLDQTQIAKSLLESAACPIVQIMDITSDPVDMIVGFSHFDAARVATEHLLTQGYRRLAFLGARMDPRTQHRFDGFKTAASGAGAFDTKRVVTTTQPSTVTMGSQLFSDLLVRSPDVDAVFCNNDDLALGALFEAQRRNISIPNDLGICGFNDLEMMASAEPALTSVRTQRYKMGLKAVSMLLDRISNNACNGQRIIDLGFDVQVRASTNRAFAVPSRKIGQI